jgi:hypothetical protein
MVKLSLFPDSSLSKSAVNWRVEPTILHDVVATVMTPAAGPLNVRC